MALYFLTLAWFWAYLPEGTRRRAWVAAMPKVLATIGILEVFYIALQSGRGVASHFNEATALEEALFNLMGIGAVAPDHRQPGSRHSHRQVGPGRALSRRFGAPSSRACS